jgi:hypothetical protein
MATFYILKSLMTKQIFSADHWSLVNGPSAIGNWQRLPHG